MPDETRTQIVPVFPTWFASRHWSQANLSYWEQAGYDSFDEFNEALRLALYEERARDPEGIYRSNAAGTWHSRDRVTERTGKPGAVLHQMFGTVFSNLAAQHAKDLNATLHWKIYAWSMMYRAGGYAAPHTHPNCHFSGVYYVDPGPASEGLTMATGEQVQPGMFEAIDTRGVNAQAPGLHLQPGFRLAPKAGQMVAFPSWLPHFVHPVRGDHMRIAIAANAIVLKQEKKEQGS